MAKKHQIFSSKKKTRTAAGRKWRRVAKQSLLEQARGLPPTKPTVEKPKSPKKKKGGFVARAARDVAD